MARININELAAVREKHAGQRMVFASGCFDLTHAGHVLFFEDAKALGDVLVVMIGADAVTKRIKGDERPIFNEHVRQKIVDSLKPVDYTFLDQIAPEGMPQLYFIDMVLEKLRPDMYVINEDASDIPYRKAFMEKHPGTKLVILPRSCPPEFENVSTSKLIEKIKSIPK